MESWSKPWQISGLRAGAHTVSMSCCPIEIGELKQTKAVPDNTTHKCKESSKAVRPLALECDKSQQNIKQQGCPKLPANSMFGVAQFRALRQDRARSEPEQVADFKGLLDLLEEGFDTPAASIKVTDTAWSNRSSYRSKLSGMMTQAIANIVQSNRVGQLRKQKTDDMAPWRKGARLLVHPVLTGKFFRQMRRDKFAKLMQCAGIVFGRRDCFHSLDSLVGIPRRPTLFLASNNNPQLHPMG